MSTTKAIPIKAGEVIGKSYRVVRRLGEGGCGTVFRCTDANGDTFAIKMLHSMADLPRFTREAKVTSEVSSRRGGDQHIVAAYGHNIHDSRWPYLVLEYCDGGSVADLLDRRKKLPPAQAAWILVQAIRGLKVAKTTHRDIKPENLLIVKGSAGRGYEIIPNDCERGLRIKVSDFGLAKSLNKRTKELTLSGTVMGTPAYMSPEQCEESKQVSFKTDIYALGVMLYEMVKGKVPFDAKNVHAIMTMQINDTPNFRGLPPAVAAICRNCLAKKPGDRYRSLPALERDLVALMNNDPRAEQTPAAASPSGGSRSLRLIMIALVIIAIAAAAWWFREPIMAYIHEWME